jgi:hypothetical protein
MAFLCVTVKGISKRCTLVPPGGGPQCGTARSCEAANAAKALVFLARGIQKGNCGNKLRHARGKQQFSAVVTVTQCGICGTQPVKPRPE